MQPSANGRRRGGVLVAPTRLDERHLGSTRRPALAFVCFAVGERMEASGFVAAFTGGLAFSFMTKRRVGNPLSTQVCDDAAGQLLELLVFAMFGAFAVIDGWRRADWRMVVFAVLALFAVRIAAVLVSLIRTDLPMPSRLFIGWFGPRGIGTVVLGLLVVNRGEIQQADVIGTVVVVAVTLSLVLHSVSAAPGIRGLASAAGGRAGDRRMCGPWREAVGCLTRRFSKPCGPLVKPPDDDGEQRHTDDFGDVAALGKMANGSSFDVAATIPAKKTP